MNNYVWLLIDSKADEILDIFIANEVNARRRAVILANNGFTSEFPEDYILIAYYRVEHTSLLDIDDIEINGCFELVNYKKDVEA